MSLALTLLLCAAVGDVYTDKAKIDGLGEISLPPGKWELEIAQKAGEKHIDSLYVFKKRGDRLERLSFQQVGSKYAGRLGNYFDSIGDSFSNGVPLRGNEKGEHDLAHIIQPMKTFRYTGGKATGTRSSYIYTDSGEKSPPWMSHACVTDQGGWVLISVHASPFVLSPETIEEVVDGSKFEKPAEKPESKAAAR